MTTRLKADLGLVLTTLIWGSNFVVVKAVLSHASPFVFLAVRFSLAALILAVLYRSSLRRLTRADLRAGLILGLFLFAGYAFQTTGLALTTASKSAFIIGSAIVLVPIFLALFWGRRATAWMWAGAAAATGGLYLLTGPAQGLGALHRGDLLTFCAAVLYALHIIYVGQFSPHHPVLALTLLQVAVTAALSAIFIPLAAVTRIERPRIDASPAFFFALLLTVVGATVIAFSIHIWAQRHTSATHAALVFSLEPVFASITSFLVLGERLAPRGFAGAALILGGILLVEILGPVHAIADSTDATTDVAAARDS
jgi:drug/metabolite transporter (DMT)-like permease